MTDTYQVNINLKKELFDLLLKNLLNQFMI